MAEITYEPDTKQRANECSDTATALKDKVSETAEKMKEKTDGIGRSVQQSIDEKRQRTADTLHTAASKLHESAENLASGRLKVAELAHGAAEKIDATAGYIREHDVRAMTADVRNVVRKYPGRSLLIAAGVAFLLGRALSSDD